MRARADVLAQCVLEVSTMVLASPGEVLAGIIAGLLARGCAPLTAAAWGAWLHGEAGRRLAETMGPIGYLARELPALVPALMRGAC